MIRANKDYSLLLTEASRCFVSDPESTSFSRIHLESGKIDKSNCFLGPNYVIIDTNRGVHFWPLNHQNSKFQDFTAVKILENSNFIDFYCNSDKIWALNSKRQVFLAPLFCEENDCKYFFSSKAYPFIASNEK